jgi:hypothetical protein
VITKGGALPEAFEGACLQHPFHPALFWSLSGVLSFPFVPIDPIAADLADPAM